MGFWNGKGDCEGDLDEISLKTLELARALVTAPKLLVEDEIAADLTEREIPEMLDVVGRFRREKDGYARDHRARDKGLNDRSPSRGGNRQR